MRSPGRSHVDVTIDVRCYFLFHSLSHFWAFFCNQFDKNIRFVWEHVRTPRDTTIYFHVIIHSFAIIPYFTPTNTHREISLKITCILKHFWIETTTTKKKTSSCFSLQRLWGLIKATVGLIDLNGIGKWEKSVCFFVSYYAICGAISSRGYTNTQSVESQNEKLCGIHHESCAWNIWTIVKHLLLLLYKWIVNLLYYRDIFYWMQIQLNQCMKCILLFTCISLALSIIECMEQLRIPLSSMVCRETIKINEWMDVINNSFKINNNF